MSTVVSVLIGVFLVGCMVKMYLAAVDAKQDDDLFKKQEQQIAELQKRVAELEAR